MQGSFRLTGQFLTGALVMLCATGITHNASSAAMEEIHSSTGGTAGALEEGLVRRLNIPEVARDARELERAIEHTIVRVLRERPELVFQALQDYMEREEAEALARIRNEDARLGVGESTPHFGPLGEGPPILFFYDYACGSCADTAMALGGIAYETAMPRVYLIDVAGSPEALSTSRILLAAREKSQDLFEALHVALVGSGRVDSAMLARLGDEIGFDSDDLLAAAREADVGSLASARDLARRWGVTELPTVVIGNRKIGGQIPPDRIIEIIREEASLQNPEGR